MKIAARIWGGIKRARASVKAWSPERKKVVAVAAGGAAAGVGLGVLAARRAKPSVVINAGGSPQPQPTPPAPGAKPSGTTFVVVTPKKTGGVLRKTAGGAKVTVIPEGALVTGMASTMANGVAWYLVSTTRGQGWMTSEILKWTA
jgi:hypothetical protein